MENKYYTNERAQQIVLAQLKARGIRKVIASPGTTNITLVASMQHDSFFEMYSCVDERSAAYIACGLAEESGEPVVLSCTGATASRNYMPGLTEAFYRKLPVIAITSNQGEEKIGHHIPQNIDRRSIPNDIAKISVNIPVIHSQSDEWNVNVLINKALLELKHNGGGPVHINLATTYSHDFSVKVLPEPCLIDRITSRNDMPVMTGGKIAVFVGSHSAFDERLEAALDTFCSSNNAVVFCDHTSGYKGKYRVLYSLIGGQRKYHSSQMDVDLLIHIGEVSGDYYTLGIRPKEVWRVNEDGEIRDTFGKLRYVFEMPEIDFFMYYTYEKECGDTYLKACREEYAMAISQLPELPFSNIWIAKNLSSVLPENSVLHLGILNTLRSWNFFDIPSTVRSYCNVGGFGIDGDISSLIGASLANPDKIYIGVLGDLAFFYDMNVLGNHHLPNNVRILLLNNGRGTEFRNYGHMGHMFGEDSDKYIAAAGHFGNKSRNLIMHYAEDLGFEYITADNKESFLNRYSDFINPQITDYPMIFEVFTDSKDESEALEIILNYLDNSVHSIKHDVKNVAKKLLGDKGIRVIQAIKG